MEYHCEKISVSGPYWSQYGSGFSILGQYGSGFRIQVFHFQYERRKEFEFNSIFSSSQIAIKTFKKDSQAQIKYIRLLLKGQCSFRLEIFEFFFFFRSHFDCAGSGSVFPIRIRILGSNFNTDPHASGSEPTEKIIKDSSIDAPMWCAHVYISVAYE